LITEARLTVADLKARAVDVEMERPVQTAAGRIATALMVLIDLRTDEGTTGRSYVRSYATFALEPLRRLVENLGAALVGDALAPLEIDRKLQGMFRLLGPQGLTGIAASGIDMAAWDALAKAHGLPLVELLGGAKKEVPAYGSLRSMRPESVVEEARELSDMGFDAYKVKIGHGGIGADLEAIGALRGVIGEGAKLAVDYNQSLSVTGRSRGRASSTGKGSGGSRSPPAPTTSRATPGSRRRRGPRSASARTGGGRTTSPRASKPAPATTGCRMR
jgi:mandelate racemase